MTEHTPTPWSICNKGDCPCLTIWCPDHPICTVESGVWGDEYPALRLVGETSLDRKAEAYMERIEYGAIDTTVARANALLIIKAVNNHDALVQALTKTVAFYDNLIAPHRQGEAQLLDELATVLAAVTSGVRNPET